MNKEMHWFEQGAAFTRKYFSWMLLDTKKTEKKLRKYFTSDYRDKLNFTGLDVEPRDILLLAYAGAFISFIAFFIFDLLGAHRLVFLKSVFLFRTGSFITKNLEL